MPLVIFEEEQSVLALAPFSLTRPVFNIKLGLYSLIELLHTSSKLHALLEKNKLSTILVADFLGGTNPISHAASETKALKQYRKFLYNLYPSRIKAFSSLKQSGENSFSCQSLHDYEEGNTIAKKQEPYIFLNAALPPCESSLVELLQLLINSKQKELLCFQHSTLNASGYEHAPLLAGKILPSLKADSLWQIITKASFTSAKLSKGAQHAYQILQLEASINPLVENLEDLLTFFEKLLPEHLQIRSSLSLADASHELIEIQPGVWVSPHAKIAANTLLKTNTQNKTHGHPNIIIEAGVEIKPFCYIQGPAYFGKNTLLAPHSYVSTLSTGVHVKLAGEINTCLFHDFSNKSHFGFLGDTIVGSWVNLGAGTTSSNLKASYGPVHTPLKNLTHPYLPASQVSRIFMGSFIGDYVKTAILSKLAPGSQIGPCAFVKDDVPKDVPPFFFAGHSKKSADKNSIENAVLRREQRMHARRNLQLSHESVVLLTKLCRYFTSEKK